MPMPTNGFYLDLKRDCHLLGAGKLVERLLDRASLDARCDGGDAAPPLHWAAWLNRPDACSLLLEKGEPVDTALPRNGETALHVAVRHGVDCLSVLLQAGADPHAKNLKGASPVHVAFNIPTAKESSKSLLAALRPLGRPLRARDIAHSKTVAMARQLASLTPDCELEMAGGEGEWTNPIVAETLAKRRHKEASELRKAAKQAKPKPAAPRGRL